RLLRRTSLEAMTAPAYLLSRLVSASLTMNLNGRVPQGNFNFAVQSVRLEDEARGAAELSGDAAFDQLGAKAPFRGVGNRWAALLAPVQTQNWSEIVGTYWLPMNLNASTRYGQCTVFRSVGRELMHGHGQRQNCTWPQHDVLATQTNPF